MTKRPQYGPPANVDDFDDSTNPSKLRNAWHQRVSGTIIDQTHDQVLTGDPDVDATLYVGERSFFDGLDNTTTPISVPWSAFPKTLSSWYPDDDDKRWIAAETPAPFSVLAADVELDKEDNVVKVNEVLGQRPLQHRQQDEYCEWFTHTDPATGNVTRIDFTAENPDYWEEMAKHDFDLVVAKYQQYVSKDVVPDDLKWQYDAFARDRRGEWALFGVKGRYSPYNKWNTTDGAMHLTHPANNLFAEIVLAAQATVQRPVQGGKPHTSSSLACCASYGSVTRSSDPSIGFTVNDQVSRGNRVALADPVGLYIAKLDRAARGTWEVSRGSEADKMILRASFVPDEDAPPLKYGGQIADNIQMNLYAIAESINGTAPTLEPCPGKCCSHPQRQVIQESFDISTDCGALASFWARVTPYPRDTLQPLDVGVVTDDAPRPQLVAGQTTAKYRATRVAY